MTVPRFPYIEHAIAFMGTTFSHYLPQLVFPFPTGLIPPGYHPETIAFKRLVMSTSMSMAMIGGAALTRCLALRCGLAAAGCGAIGAAVIAYHPFMTARMSLVLSVIMSGTGLALVGTMASFCG